ncbi:hypothetical protein [Bacillus kexueae]|uniref:hypothetical protein n=1 Tax=Aeribacillus kexueae TaxID=2078952 RepID=UPI001FAF4076|nr:hypothetical protein [Bacillus kexueae]
MYPKYFDGSVLAKLKRVQPFESSKPNVTNKVRKYLGCNPYQFTLKQKEHSSKQ